MAGKRVTALPAFLYIPDWLSYQSATGWHLYIACVFLITHRDLKVRYCDYIRVAHNTGKI